MEVLKFIASISKIIVLVSCAYFLIGSMFVITGAILSKLSGGDWFNPRYDRHNRWDSGEPSPKLALWLWPIVVPVVIVMNFVSTFKTFIEKIVDKSINSLEIHQKKISGQKL